MDCYKNKHYGLIICVLMIIFLCGCDVIEDNLQPPIDLKEEPIITSEIIFPQNEQVALPDIPIVTEDDSIPPSPDMVRSKLTNEWVSKEIASTRPIAVMTPNESAAVPHYSLSEASIIYEANVEGRMTRMMAIYDNWRSLKRIGNIRSLRLYFAYWALEWDAFIVHFGGPLFIDELLASPTTENIDGNSGGSDAFAFFRSSERQAPHNAYATGSGLATAIQKKGYSLEYRGLTDTNHFQFASKSTPTVLEENAVPASYIDMSGCYPLTRCYFEFNEEDGLYYRSQHLSGSSDGPHIDAVTGQQLCFKNVIVQFTECEEIGEGYLAFQCHDSGKQGWFFTNGAAIPITWEKATDFGATKYYDLDGNEIVLNTGKTMICIVENGDTFTFH